MSAACPVFGFDFSFRERAERSDVESDAVWHEFIAVVESRGLAAGGGLRDGWWRHTITGEGAQAIDADRDALLAWAEGHPSIVTASAGPLVDINAR